MDDIKARVKAVVGRVLRIDPEKLKDSDNFVNDLGAESIQSIELVAEFEEEFDIEMEEDDALGVQRVGDAVEFIRKIIAS